ncbi:hypothetical protein KEM52_001008 [Ascosphaera acerosa]|nr:hypothetical protein KEM52_001008 [Ascosphaera acerosa]
MSFGTIYSYPNNPRVFKALVCAKLNGLDVQLDKDFKVQVDNVTPEYKAKFPTGQVPAFSSASGVHLFDSDAIAQFLAESGPAAERLLGSTPAERAQIRQWIAFSGSDVQPAFMMLLIPRFGLTKYEPAVDAVALPRLWKHLGNLEAHLKDRTYLTSSDKYNLADLSVMSVLWLGFAHIIGTEERAKYPNVVQWFERVAGDEDIKAIFGEPKYIDKMVIPESN